MTNIRVFYNTNPLAKDTGWRDDDILMVVFEGVVVVCEPISVANEIFHLYNDSVPLLWPRSMTVGDVVELKTEFGQVFYLACDSDGWRNVTGLFVERS